MSLVKTSDFVGGAYFKPADHMTDIALLVEPKSIERNVPNEYQGRVTNRDEVTADITVFANTGAIESGTPTEIIKGAKVVHGMLTETLSKMLGEASVAIVAKIPTKRGSGFVWRDASPDATAKVAAYYEGRAAALEAALADVPDFE